MDKHSGGISKGADSSPQHKQTNKQTSQIPFDSKTQKMDPGWVQYPRASVYKKTNVGPTLA